MADSFEKMVSKHGDAMFRCAYTYCNNIQDAEDIVQEVFCKYLQKKPDFEDESHEKAWLLRVTINTSKNFVHSFWHRNVRHIYRSAGAELHLSSDAAARIKDMEGRKMRRTQIGVKILVFNILSIGIAAMLIVPLAAYGAQRVSQALLEKVQNADYSLEEIEELDAQLKDQDFSEEDIEALNELSMNEHDQTYDPDGSNSSLFEVNADTVSDTDATEDEVVLVAGVGSEEGELGYIIGGGGSGPEAFTVTSDGYIYIVDNVNKRVNVYQNGSFIYDIDIPYILYIRSMVVSDGIIYLMDYDVGSIYAVDADGSVEQNIKIPSTMEKYNMHRLYLNTMGDVKLLYDCGVDGEWSEYSYFVEELAEGIVEGVKGYSKDENLIYQIMYTGSYGALINTSSNVSRENDIDCSTEAEIVTNGLLGKITILNVDSEGVIYTDIYEMADTSIVTGEYTVKKYIDNECTEIALVDLNDYYFTPNEVLMVSEEGDLYQILCLENEVQIIKKAFVDIDNFSLQLP